MNGMDGSDAAEVARARAGDSEAFRVLVERHSRNIFRLAYRMTGNEHDAEDVVQETFLKAYRRLDQFEERANFGSWLHRIAANCSFDVLRSRQRRDESHPLPDEDLSVVDTLVATDPSPDRVLFGEEVRRKLKGAMGRMSAIERSAFTLRHYEGLSIQEIGEVLGLEANAAKHSIFRAVRKLRQALAPVMSPCTELSGRPAAPSRWE